LREIDEGRQKTLNINGLARTALEREREVGAYKGRSRGSRAVSGHVQRCRRERRSGSEDSLGNRVRRSREPGRFPGESRRITTSRTCLFYRQFFRHTPYCGNTTIGLPPLTIHLQQPGSGHGRRLRWRRSGLKAFGTIWRRAS